MLRRWVASAGCALLFAASAIPFIAVAPRVMRAHSASERAQRDRSSSQHEQRNPVSPFSPARVR
jgi:hypothetical protein